ncbi:hypothetical protein [Ferruginibacter albus]|uniref:hypothetical protein n=1 Tax=Ferruginibacter albus TaxID=2875540 RepID=UPI001CC436D7|nr:hypothetical protein [Ferruginibacter albus]UAY52840.1 hypothetical protein K9M53_03965 [Ferruginibacter albus]
MKKMTCKQLGGACDMEFKADTFEKIAELSKRHAMDMFEKGDKPHIKSMAEMTKNMKSATDMQAWVDGKKREFYSLPEIK